MWLAELVLRDNRQLSARDPANRVLEWGTKMGDAKGFRESEWFRCVEGFWSRIYLLDQVRGACKARPERGVYRLIAVKPDYKSMPMPLERICGPDMTGTLYIGREGRTFSNRSRPQQLARILLHPRTRGGSTNIRCGATSCPRTPRPWCNG